MNENQGLILFVTFMLCLLLVLIIESIWHPNADVYNVLVAATALAVSITFGIGLRDYNTKTLTPLPMIDKNSKSDEASWIVSNAGKGPLLIQKIFIHINGKEIVFTSNTKLRCLLLEMLDACFDNERFTQSPDAYMENKYNKDHENNMLHSLRVKHELETVNVGGVTLENNEDMYPVQGSSQAKLISITWQGTNQGKMNEMLSDVRNILLNSEILSISFDYTDLYGNRYHLNS